MAEENANENLAAALKKKVEDQKAENEKKKEEK